VQADNCKISGCTIRNCYLGIFSSAQAYLTVEDNTVEGSLKDGMRFYGAAYYTIQGNLIRDNAVSGIALQGYYAQVVNNTFVGNERSLGLGSSYSVVYGNWMLQNSESGIFLAGSNNVVVANQIEDNKWGVFITPQLAAPHDNTFYHNNFVDNTYGVFVNASAPLEFWDSGETLGGNYWSDYTAKYPQASKSDAFYTAPYQVYEGAQDNYPLTQQFDIANSFNPPAHREAPEIKDGLAAYWTFDQIDATGITPDQTGKNPAILGSIGRERDYIPQTVQGEIGEALAFDGQEYVNVLPSPSMEISGELTVDVWVKVQDYKEIPYNNIIVEARRGPESYPNRTFGVAINGEAPQNSSAAEIGAIRAYVRTDEGLNEIVTTQPAIELDTWTHILFTRSLQTGMHIYVNGQEQEVKVTSGTQNPQGATLRQTETYIGHDAICTIDELKLSYVAGSAANPLWMQWWLWAVIIASGLLVAAFMLFARRSKAHKNPFLGKV
jgi:parallel beta-helix repeat protein